MATKFVTNADGKGWLIVRYSNDNSTWPPLPQFMRVDYQSTQNGRDYFTLKEGQFAGRQASVRLKDSGGSYLADGDPALPPAKVIIALDTCRLWYGGKGPLSIVPNLSNPCPVGTHDLEIPDEVHPGGAAYLSQSPFAETWFRIGHSGDRYLHAGSFTAGCVTVNQIIVWTDIYSYLIQRRKGDGRSVGTIRVYATEASMPKLFDLWKKFIDAIRPFWPLRSLKRTRGKE